MVTKGQERRTLVELEQLKQAAYGGYLENESQGHVARVLDDAVFTLRARAREIEELQQRINQLNQELDKSRNWASELLKEGIKRGMKAELQDAIIEQLSSALHSAAQERTRLTLQYQATERSLKEEITKLQVGRLEKILGAREEQELKDEFGAEEDSQSLRSSRSFRDIIIRPPTALFPDTATRNELYHLALTDPNKTIDVLAEKLSISKKQASQYWEQMLLPFAKSSHQAKPSAVVIRLMNTGGDHD